MMFAIDEINRDDRLLPNISLGYRIVDSCASPTIVLRAALTLVSGSEEKGSECHPAPITALVAESGSTQSLVVAEALGPFRVPMALLVKQFGWTWIGALQSDNDYGRYGIAAFAKEAEGLGICIAFVGTILRTYPQSKLLEVVDMIKKSNVKVILAGDLYPLMQEVLKQNITGIQWIASEAWVTADRPSTPEMFKSFGGTIGFVVRKMAMLKLGPVLRDINPYQELNSSFVSDFWETMVGCKPLSSVNVLPNITKICRGNEKPDYTNKFFDVTQLRDVYKVYQAVYAIAHALHQVVFCEMPGGNVSRKCLNVSDITPKQVRCFLLSIASYSSDIRPSNSVCSEICPLGTRKARIKGLPVCCFDCIPCADGSISNTTGTLTDCIICPIEYWSNERKDSCIMKVTEFLSYTETMGIVLVALSLFGACVTFSTLVVFIHFRETPIVKANNSDLSLLLLVSLILCFLCPLTFIGEPTVWSGMLRHTTFGITFALCISCVLGKTIVVVTAFRATLPGNNMAAKFGPAQQRGIVCSCTAIQVVICILWLNISPPFPNKLYEQSNKKIILECNTGSDAAFYSVLGYISLLAVICLVLAFLARKLPDNFNEAKVITLRMLIFCAVWITFIPAYISSPGKYTVAVEIFAILSSAFGLLFCIFMPKCYIILIKPEKNTKKHMMGKNTKHAG
uniref:G-protein coupled receptors family 3 profile domain-containing protein n=1 Tax=Astyanax mexicanus TaxID=7994 RepID=A0A8B9GVW7_ASTMX